MPTRGPGFWRSLAAQDARAAGLDPNIFLRQINKESRFDPNARSGAGAVGIAEIVPRYHPNVDPTDPYASLKYAANYMASLVHKYGGSYAKALSVYNSGQPNRYQDPNFSGGQTYNYVRSILGGQTPSAANPIPAQTAAVPALGNPTTTPQDASKQRGLQLLKGLLKGEDIPNLLQDIKTVPNKPLTAALGAPTQLPALNSKTPNIPTMQAGTSKKDLQAVSLVKEYLGTPYVWGGSAPGGFDCSGLLQYTWAKAGVNIPRTTYDQWKTGSPVKGKLRAGDAVFFEPTKAGPGHVGMYIGGGKFIEAPHTGASVRVSTLKGRPDYMGARRFA
jgi:cell wall-associated NlpC family hydrolase